MAVASMGQLAHPARVIPALNVTGKGQTAYLASDIFAVIRGRNQVKPRAPGLQGRMR